MGEKLEKEKEILREREKEERQIVGIRKRLRFQVRVENFASLGNQQSPFSTQSTHQGYPDASFTDPLLPSSLRYT